MKIIKKITTIVFGDLPIATKVLKNLLSKNNVQVLGVVTTGENVNNNDPWADQLLTDFARKKNIQIFKLNELTSAFNINELDIGFSCRFSEIIKKNVIKLFKNGIVNFHGGLLPERAGVNTVCHSILLSDEFAGGTLHFVDTGIDTGDIIAKSKFKIQQNDTSYILFKKTQLLLWDLYINNIDLILTNKINRIKQSEYFKKGFERTYFDKKSLLNEKKIIINSKDYTKIKRKTLAFDFPNHQKAYIQNQKDIKIFLSTIDFDEKDYNIQKTIRDIKKIVANTKNNAELGQNIRALVKNI